MLRRDAVHLLVCALVRLLDLWAGLVILAGGAVFLAWDVLRPLRAEDLQDTDTDRPKAE